MSRRKQRELVWLNGRVLPAARARISVFDRGLLYGDAAFETVRIYSGLPFRWAAHRRRLAGTLDRLRMKISTVDLRQALEELMTAANLREAAVRLTVTRGPSEELLPPRNATPTTLLIPRPIPAGLEDTRARGVRTIRLPFGQGRFGFTAGHKTTNYAAAVIGRRLAHDAGAFEGLYVEQDGYLSEATTSNLFAVRKGRLLTPPVETGCLPGITRDVVLDLAHRAGIPAHERTLRATDLPDADEVFLTGSVIEVLPVVRVDRHPIAAGAPGPITRTLQDAYRRAVRRSVAGARKST